MKICLLIPALVFTIVTCGQSQTLQVTQFYKQISDSTRKTILDVRTPQEYEQGHLAQSVNINWADSGFIQKTGLLNKELPVYIYCLSGSRSAKAAQQLRENGFMKVYEMEGGMMKWRAADLPEEKNKPATEELSKTDFEKMVTTNKIVLVDFYADWCEPCKKMEPYLVEIEKEMSAKVELVRINADKNETLMDALKIDGLPVLHIYKNGKLTWAHLGFINKKEVLTKLNAQ